MAKDWREIREERRGVMREIWRKACEHDGVSVDSRFVVFSDDNPYRIANDEATISFQEACQQVAFRNLNTVNGGF